ncbi:MAG: CHAD domain-containing protein [Candidatus Omnitrophica bacterium]|nr:CHAD domain-containing protein [Candidatus Omnitrophota bacterium]
MKNSDFCVYAGKILSRHLQVLLKEAPAAGRGSDLEPLHRARVSSRRLRAALHAFHAGGLLPDRKTGQWIKQLSRIGRAFGPVRELDVQIRCLLRLKRKPENSGYQAGISALIRFCEKSRQTAQKQIDSALAGAVYDINSLNIFLTSDLLKTKAPTARQFAGGRKKIILKRLRQLLAHDVDLGQPSNIQKLHAARIAAKKLRYTLEIFQPFYGRRMNPFIDAALGIQEILGDIHELDVWQQFLSRNTGIPQTRNFQAWRVHFQKSCAVERARAYNKFFRIWTKRQRQHLWQNIQKII